MEGAFAPKYQRARSSQSGGGPGLREGVRGLASKWRRPRFFQSSGGPYPKAAKDMVFPKIVSPLRPSGEGPGFPPRCSQSGGGPVFPKPQRPKPQSGGGSFSKAPQAPAFPKRRRPVPQSRESPNVPKVPSPCPKDPVLPRRQRPLLQTSGGTHVLKAARPVHQSGEGSRVPKEAEAHGDNEHTPWHSES